MMKKVGEKIYKIDVRFNYEKKYSGLACTLKDDDSILCLENGWILDLKKEGYNKNQYDLKEYQPTYCDPTMITEFKRIPWLQYGFTVERKEQINPANADAKRIKNLRDLSANILILDQKINDFETMIGTLLEALEQIKPQIDSKIAEINKDKEILEEKEFLAAVHNYLDREEITEYFGYPFLGHTEPNSAPTVCIVGRPNIKTKRLGESMADFSFRTVLDTSKPFAKEYAEKIAKDLCKEAKPLIDHERRLTVSAEKDDIRIEFLIGGKAMEIYDPLAEYEPNIVDLNIDQEYAIQEQKEDGHIYTKEWVYTVWLNMKKVAPNRLMPAEQENRDRLFKWETVPIPTYISPLDIKKIAEQILDHFIDRYYNGEPVDQAMQRAIDCDVLPKFFEEKLQEMIEKDMKEME